jgi:salicylate hydroxylase
MSSSPPFQPLQCAIIGAGLGGLCAAIALRRQGHFFTIYERYDFAGEIGAGIGIVSNGTYFLEKQWNVDMSKAKLVVLKKLVRHDWKTGEVQGETPVGDYKAKFGTDYYGTFRIDIHNALLDEALQEDGQGPPCKLLTNHRLVDLKPETGICKFENGVTIQADITVGADGIKVWLPMR